MSNNLTMLEPVNVGGRPEALSLEEIKLALVNTRGRKTMAARHLGVSRSTLYNYIERYPEIMDTVQDYIELAIDEMELIVERKARAGHIGAAKLFLFSMGRDRGWGRRATTSG